MSELKYTLETHPNIFKVHYDTLGRHYFNVHEVDGISFGQFCDGKPLINSRITETKTREEVLGKSRNFDTTDKTEFIEQKIEERKERKKNK